MSEMSVEGYDCFVNFCTLFYVLRVYCVLYTQQLRFVGCLNRSMIDRLIDGDVVRIAAESARMLLSTALVHSTSPQDAARLETAGSTRGRQRDTGATYILR